MGFLLANGIGKEGTREQGRGKSSGDVQIPGTTYSQVADIHLPLIWCFDLHTLEALSTPKSWWLGGWTSGQHQII